MCWWRAVAEILGIEPDRHPRGDRPTTDLNAGVDPRPPTPAASTLMMGNAAIQAAERARAISSPRRVSKKNCRYRRIGLVFRRPAASFDTENADTGRQPSPKRSAWRKAMFGTIGFDRGPYTPPALRREVQRVAAVGSVPHLLLLRRPSSKSRSTPRPAGFTCRARLDSRHDIGRARV